MTGILIIGGIVLFVLWVIYAGWSAPLMKENEDGSWTTIRPERKFSELFRKKFVSNDIPDFQHTPSPPSPIDDLPTSLLIDNDRMLYIAGIKSASPEKIAEWQADRKAKQEEKSAFSDKQLMEYLESKNEELQVKAGIKAYDRSKGGDEIYEADFNIKTGKKGANEIVDAMINAAKSNTLANTEALNEIREKQIRKEIEYKKKMDFEALPFSRLTQDARDQITKIVREDISKQLEDVSHISKAVADFNDQRLGMEVTKPKRKYTKKKK